MLTVWALTYLAVFSLPVLSTLAAVGSICVYTCSSILAWISFTFICVWKGKVKIQYEFIYTTNYKKNLLSHKQKEALTLPFMYFLKSHSNTISAVFAHSSWFALTNIWAGCVDTGTPIQTRIQVTLIHICNKKYIKTTMCKSIIHFFFTPNFQIPVICVLLWYNLTIRT